MTTHVLLGVIAGTKLAVFLLLLLFIYMVSRAADRFDFRPMYVVGLSFLMVAIGEFSYVLALNNPQTAIFPWLNDIENLQLFRESFYLIAGLGSIVFLRTFRDDLDSGA